MRVAGIWFGKAHEDGGAGRFALDVLCKVGSGLEAGEVGRQSVLGSVSYTLISM